MGSWLSYKEEEGIGEEKRMPALLLEVEEEVVVAALLGLGGGKRIPCVGLREGAFPALFFGFIILLSIFLLGLTATQLNCSVHISNYKCFHVNWFHRALENQSNF